MADYSRWVEKMLSVTTLQLDPENPRIPPAGKALGQRELIAELVQHDNVYELAREIADDGFHPVESLVGFVEDDKTLVLEGNRRLAALKLLISPELAPDDAHKKFARIAGNVDLEAIKKVRVFIAPNRDAATPFLLARHTREHVQRWTPLMQARFYRSLAGSGVSVEELSRRYGVSVGEIAKFFRIDTMYQIALNVDLPDESKQVVHDPRKFPAAVLERLVDVPSARRFLGFDFDALGQVRGSVHPEEFKKAYAKVLSDIASHRIDTRRLNKTVDVDKYLASIKSHAPDKSRKGSFAGVDLIPTSAPAPTTAPPTKAAKGPRRTGSLVTAGMACRLDDIRIRDVFDEFKRLRPRKWPNSSAVMLRILLELSVGHYLDKTGKIQPLLDKAKKDKKGADWYPTLRQMLNQLLLDPTPVNAKPLVLKGLRRFTNKDVEEHLSLGTLDGYVHNRYVTPKERDLRVFMSLLQPIFDLVLEEPPAPPKPGAKPSTP